MLDLQDTSRSSRGFQPRKIAFCDTAVPLKPFIVHKYVPFFVKIVKFSWYSATY